MKTAIICSGYMEDYRHFQAFLSDFDYIICADGGTRHAYAMKIKPDIIIGDMDSSSHEYTKYFDSLDVRTIMFPAEKDKTDTQICLEYAAKFSDFIVLLGATGSRIDHMLANISLLKFAVDKGINISIADDHNEIHLINKSLRIQGVKGDMISLIPLSERVEGITIRGVGYELHEAVMEIGNPYGVSNYFIENTADIEIESGYLLVIKSKD